MSIVLVRVDDRLIHGQIVQGWLPSTKAEEVLVANDRLAADAVQTSIMHAAVPQSIKVVVETVDRIAEMLLHGDNPQTKRMILVDDPQDALRLIEAGVEFDSLNLGNLRSNEFTTTLSRSVLVGEETMEILCEILKQGVQVVIQSVPYEKGVNLMCSAPERVLLP